MVFGSANFVDSNSDGILDNMESSGPTFKNLVINPTAETGQVDITGGKGTFNGPVNFTHTVSLTRAPDITVNGVSTSDSNLDFESGNTNGLTSGAHVFVTLALAPPAWQRAPRVRMFGCEKPF